MFIILCAGIPQEIAPERRRASRGRKTAPLLADAFDKVAVFSTQEEAHTAIGRTLCHRLAEMPACRFTPMTYDFSVSRLVAAEEGAVPSKAA